MTCCVEAGGAYGAPRLTVTGCPVLFEEACWASEGGSLANIDMGDTTGLKVCVRMTRVRKNADGHNCTLMGHIN